MKQRMAAVLVAAFLVGAGGCRTRPADTTTAASPPPSALDIRFVTDEPEAVLAILSARAAGEPVPEGAWDRLFGSEGYRRLKAREAAMNRAFTDDEFRAFVLSPELAARRPELAGTLAAWRAADLEGPAARAFRYLPPGASIRAAVYPSIKPKPNSFVFEPRTDPAIFLYLDPSKTPDQLANTVAHELHHIGLAGACAEPDPSLPEGARDALDWMSGFGEGLAMLAAAGDPATHPHAASPPEERAVWDAAVARVAEDMARLDRFFLDLVAGSMTEEEALERGFRFVVDEGVPQGAFYTVGWHMAATVERVLGRPRLVADVCDPAALLRDYDRAAATLESRGGGPQPRWSEALLEAVSG